MTCQRRNAQTTPTETLPPVVRDFILHCSSHGDIWRLTTNFSNMICKLVLSRFVNLHLNGDWFVSSEFRTVSCARVSLCVCVCLCVHTCVCLCMRVCVCGICVCLCDMYVFVCMNMSCVCMCVWLCVCMWVFLSMRCWRDLFHVFLFLNHRQKFFV